ncbi:sodium-dependent bicarbonate transport family permease [Aestuariispira insulae]|uniref:Sodium-dependent bicarbonate transport family permease n=1 Tax=Aestuariispira insulae TaxID=1461337 RepID=A0A3D9HKK6_9PROT|nr:sodium-dependent bicarbonate transport family permease [Aestuariispira insulae]RED49821.1 hypothetical protein DFP90_105193 [Aestuariispira insulae]
MDSLLHLTLENLLSPTVLFFVLGVFAALTRSSLTIPEAIAKALSIYLVMAIGFKGGYQVSKAGIDLGLFLSLLAGMLLSFAVPFLAFAMLKVTTRLPTVDAASIAAHYGSISIVTFLAGTEVLKLLGHEAEGYMVAVAAVMEVPAILSGLWIAARAVTDKSSIGGMDNSLMREVLLNGSIVLLTGAFLIGVVTGEKGMATVSAFIVDPFKGVLCLFLLDMGLVAGRGLRTSWKYLKPGLLIFGIYMPVLGAGLGLFCGWALGLSLGGTVLFMILGASASYIAVPAAMRMALPDSQPAIPLALSLGITFPFNLTIGIPLYVTVASRVL